MESELSTVETCANCGRKIGKLEKVCVWEDNVVCFECHTRLRLQDRRPQAETRIPEEELARLTAAPIREPAIRESTWSPLKAAVVEKQYRQQRTGASSRGWVWTFFVGVAMLVIGIFGVGAIGTGEAVGEAAIVPLMMVIIGAALIWIVIAFLPLIVATRRHHPNLSGVHAITVIGLFIPVLWLVAIVWAYSAPDPNV